MNSFGLNESRATSASIARCRARTSNEVRQATNLNLCRRSDSPSADRTRPQNASGAGRDGHAINTRHLKMGRMDEKQPATSTAPETPVPASSSVVNAAQMTSRVRRELPGSAAAPERSVPLHSLRNEIRVWTRDLLIAIGLALVIIVFLYQPVKVEGTVHQARGRFAG